MSICFLFVLSGNTYVRLFMEVLYTIWGLFNIGLGIALLAVSYWNFRFFAQRYGALATGILFLLTASMCQSPTSRPQTAPNPSFSVATGIIPEFSPDRARSYRARLADLGSCQLGQHITLYRKNQSDSVQITSAVYLTGFISGLLWTPTVAFANADPDRRIRYGAAGTLEWRLLGMPVYHQLKQFSASVSVDSLSAF